MFRRAHPPLAGAVCLLLAACSGSSAGDAASSSSPTASGTALTVTVSNGSVARTFTVTCDPPGGTHPRPRSACDFLTLAQKWGQDPFAPVPPDTACSQQYGGPETATVTGTWNGHPVNASFSRTDGCQIGRWDNAVALLALDPNISPAPTKRPR